MEVAALYFQFKWGFPRSAQHLLCCSGTLESPAGKKALSFPTPSPAECSVNPLSIRTPASPPPPLCLFKCNPFSYFAVQGNTEWFLLALIGTLHTGARLLGSVPGVDRQSRFRRGACRVFLLIAKPIFHPFSVQLFFNSRDLLGVDH